MSLKHATLSRSSTEVKCRYIANAMADVMWIQTLLDEFSPCIISTQKEQIRTLILKQKRDARHLHNSTLAFDIKYFFVYKATMANTEHVYFTKYMIFSD